MNRTLSPAQVVKAKAAFAAGVQDETEGRANRRLTHDAAIRHFYDAGRDKAAKDLAPARAERIARLEAQEKAARERIEDALPEAARLAREGNRAGAARLILNADLGI